MATRYLWIRKSDGAQFYQRSIPLHLRPLFGGRSLFRKYLSKSEYPLKRDVEAAVRALAVEHDATFLAGETLSEPELEALAAHGGVTEDGSFTYEVDVLLNEPEIVNDVGYGKTVPRLRPTIRTRQTIGATPKSCAQLIQNHEQVMALQAAKKLSKARATADTSWDALFKEWKDMSGAEVKRAHAATIRLLKEYFGERDCREINRKDIAQFIEDLGKQGKTRGTQEQRLKHIKAMFSAAIKNPNSVFADMSNPGLDITLAGKAPKPINGRDKAFTAQEVRHILDTAARVRFGDATHYNGLKRHEEVQWMLRLLAFTGARPNEIAQLSKEDVYEKDGIKLIHIRGNHPQKHVKTEDRLVPLHSDVGAFSDYAATKDGFIFGAFTWNKDNGRAHWLIKEFPTFLRDDCKIEGKTLYGLRHRFHDAMREVGEHGVPDDLARRLVGHVAKDEHGKYGGNLLVKLNEWMQKVKPLG
jgi:integrase